MPMLILSVPAALCRIVDAAAKVSPQWYMMMIIIFFFIAITTIIITSMMMMMMMMMMVFHERHDANGTYWRRRSSLMPRNLRRLQSKCSVLQPCKFREQSQTAGMARQWNEAGTMALRVMRTSD